MLLERKQGKKKKMKVKKKYGCVGTQVCNPNTRETETGRS
jgi:hypothetical protein